MSDDFMPQITFGIIAEYAPKKPVLLPLVRDKNISELNKSSIIPVDKLLNKIDSLYYYQDHWQSMVIQEIGCCECPECIGNRTKVIEMLELEYRQAAISWAEYDDEDE
jgi:hypothetical protein